MTLNEMFLQSYDLTESERQSLESEMITEYQGAYDSADRELRRVHLDILAGVAAADYYTTMARRNRLDKLINKVQSGYNTAANRVDTLQRNASKLSISNVYYRQIYTLNWIENVYVVLPEAYIEASTLGIVDTWNSLSARAKRRAVDRFGSITDYLPSSGVTLNDALSRNKADDLQKLKTIIQQGMVQGESYDRQTRKIREALNTTTNKALRIARTEGHRNMMMANNAMAQAAKANGIPAKRKIVSVLDNRTRPQSARVDGQVENDEGFFTYPSPAGLVKVPGNSGVARFDINDRESVVLVIEGVDPELRRARDPSTGETDIISYQSFSEWAKEKGLTKNRYGQLVG